MESVKEQNNAIRRVLRSHAPVARRLAPRVVHGELVLQHNPVEMVCEKAQNSAIHQGQPRPVWAVPKPAVQAAHGAHALLRKRAAILSAKEQKYAMRIVRVAQ